MTPYEILLSESQERMLLVSRAAARTRSLAIFAQVGARRRRHRRASPTPGASSSPSRATTSSPTSRSRRWPTDAPGVRAPRSPRPAAPRAPGSCAASEPEPADPARDCSTLLGSPNDRRKELDLPPVRPHGPRRHRRAARRGDAARRPRLQAARRRRASRSPPTATAASACSIPRGRRASPSPRRAATSSASAPSRSAVTDCLNFGNPERPEVMWQLARGDRRHRRRLPRARHPRRQRQRLALQRDRRRRIQPTPTIGMVGLIDDVATPSASRSGKPATTSRSSANPRRDRRLGVPRARSTAATRARAPR